MRVFAIQNGILSNETGSIAQSHLLIADQRNKPPRLVIDLPAGALDDRQDIKGIGSWFRDRCDSFVTDDDHREGLYLRQAVLSGCEVHDCADSVECPLRAPSTAPVQTRRSETG
ncbi:hypothetical protein [Hoeflea halophila]|uniref:hypothetical protein n=1 Tax=Hoeflea halophila TaxID=714899 RepID=UPI00117A3A63|nr:hypothetical protein [Hoeflea halophila]